jgi:GntR family transcriptional regulator, transcriptional repressor for pyruvate dehydrogenase complex
MQPATAIRPTTGRLTSKGRGPRRSPPVRSTLRPLRRLDLVRTVVERLREQIIAGAFDPNGAIPSEGQLGQALGVSRTVIREAMRSLAAQGLVEVSQGRQPRVKPADPQTVVDTFNTYMRREDHSLLDLVEVRRPLEAAIAALAAQRATPTDIESLEQTLCEQTAARTKRRRVETDIRFHDLLAKATGNPIFNLLLNAVSGLMRRSREETLVRKGVERSLTGHRAILDAVKRHDPEAARQAMLDHFVNAEQDLRGQE